MFGFAMAVVLAGMLIIFPALAEAAGRALTPEIVLAFVAAAIALALDVVPGLSTKWDTLSPELKRALWLLGCLAVGLAPWLVTCVGRVAIEDGFLVTCTAGGLIQTLQVGFLAYFASQATHGGVAVARKVIAAGANSDVPF